MPALRKHVPFIHAQEEQAQPSSSRVVAAVLANLEDSAGSMRGQMSRREFRAQVQERGRSCDEVLLELRRAALIRDAGGAGTSSDALTRRRITNRRVTANDIVRIDQLAADNVRLRRLVADQQLALEGLRRTRGTQLPAGT